MHHYYATGDTEHCPVYAKDFITCLHAQTERSNTDKRALLDSTSLMTMLKTKNSVFEMKKVPSWEN